MSSICPCQGAALVHQLFAVMEAKGLGDKGIQALRWRSWPRVQSPRPDASLSCRWRNRPTRLGACSTSGRIHHLHMKS